MNYSIQQIHELATKLEEAVKDNPYLFVPGTGPKAGAFGINYFNIIHQVLGDLSK